jgi:hypothetical protein
VAAALLVDAAHALAYADPMKPDELREFDRIFSELWPTERRKLVHGWFDRCAHEFLPILLDKADRHADAERFRQLPPFEDPQSIQQAVRVASELSDTQQTFEAQLALGAAGTFASLARNRTDSLLSVATSIDVIAMAAGHEEMLGSLLDEAKEVLRTQR